MKVILSFCCGYWKYSTKTDEDVEKRNMPDKVYFILIFWLFLLLSFFVLYVVFLYPLYAFISPFIRGISLWLLLYICSVCKYLEACIKNLSCCMCRIYFDYDAKEKMAVYQQEENIEVTLAKNNFRKLWKMWLFQMKQFNQQTSIFFV